MNSIEREEINPLNTPDETHIRCLRADDTAAWLKIIGRRSPKTAAEYKRYINRFEKSLNDKK